MRPKMNVLDFDEYRADGGKLCYEAYIQCLVDSGNITQLVGDWQIKLRQKQDRLFAEEGYEWNGEYWVKIRVGGNRRYIE
ncbi:unnamed protein product [marine sediment metagenome]|uniref:Uncharacterized protein n=1 Tax=marine sediment metagenome TaxID=412755 RepID=X0W1T7_9ZZZZ